MGNIFAFTLCPQSGPTYGSHTANATDFLKKVKDGDLCFLNGSGAGNIRRMSARISTHKFRDFLLYQAIRFFRLRGSREKGARGFAVGLACNFFPTFGLGAVISGFLAKLIGGNVVAGFIGGSTLAFFWPLLFYINMRAGSLFLRPPIIVDDLGDVTPQNVSRLVWGKTFLIGAVINSLIAAAIAYFAFLLLYQRLKPHAMHWLRSKVRLRHKTTN